VSSGEIEVLHVNRPETGGVAWKGSRAEVERKFMRAISREETPRRKKIRIQDLEKSRNLEIQSKKKQSLGQKGRTRGSHATNTS